ncbi:hypothetical protein AB205_0109050 [Aquarana catesbeiana]|uniref:Uncharacterized protein n=1 Tax=Aquarana catesbeiana TaxID=8400 RepID=A0A2G9S7F6_AQUCT|nr:hypothetical protein AB205_0109050 [Aquarana catesbeiana]
MRRTIFVLYKADHKPSRTIGKSSKCLPSLGTTKYLHSVKSFTDFISPQLLAKTIYLRIFPIIIHLFAIHVYKSSTKPTPPSGFCVNLAKFTKTIGEKEDLLIAQADVSTGHSAVLMNISLLHVILKIIYLALYSQPNFENSNQNKEGVTPITAACNGGLCYQRLRGKFVSPCVVIHLCWVVNNGKFYSIFTVLPQMEAVGSSGGPKTREHLFDAVLQP